MLSIDVTDQQKTLAIDSARLVRASQAILRDARIEHAEVDIAVVDDATIHSLNRQFLAHDFPTDVLSFLLERADDRLEGEVVVSADTAARAAAEYGWPPADELLLYVIHGTLHLVGFDDHSPEERAAIRAAEERYLALFGLVPHEEAPVGDEKGA